ncbi:MAG: radical SAM-associated putative lipoprotein [Bacteroidetes bacterium]|nr:radical SAM-associated putative lipoprotein [Bacteroidota bacterium]
MNRIYYKILRRLLLISGLFFGFCHTIMAQYGIIETRFTVKGSAKSDPCGEAIPDLKVDVVVRSGSNLYEVSNGKTNDKGEFEISDYGPGNRIHGYLLRFTDTDGAKNGVFADTLIELGEAVRKSSWDYEMDKAVEVKLKCVVCDCKQPEQQAVKEPEDTLIPEQPETGPNSDTLPEAILNEDQSVFDVPKKQDISATPEIGIIVFPNPSDNEIHLKLDCESYNGNIDIALLDSKSGIVFHKKHYVSSVSDMITFDPGNLAPGTYYLRINLSDRTLTAKIVRK